MINEIKQDIERRMQKSLESLGTAFKRVRTGRAHPGLLDEITVAYYGADTPLNQMANISVEDGRTLTVSPFDKQVIPDIEKAIMKSNLGLNPSSNSELIRIPMPPLTEETRKDMVKIVRGEAESSRVAMRNIRRDANSDIKEYLKEKEISEDEAHKGEEDIQKLTDKYIAMIEVQLKVKESELMEV